MKRTRLWRTSLLARCCLLGLTLLTAQAEAATAPPLPARDEALIAEAYHLWSSVAASLWPGAAAIRVPFLYIGQTHEYAIGFPASLDGFLPTGESVSEQRRVQVRERQLARDVSASFSIQGTPAVVIGSPEALGRSLGQWVMTAGHEMFHVFQAARGSYEKVAALGIGPRDDASWQLAFPFPYTDPDVMRLLHLQGYLVWLASTTPDAREDAQYNLNTALDAMQVYRSRLRQLTGEEKAYRYSQFQEWTEGVAAYTEYKLAEQAAQPTYRPTPAYTALPTAQSYAKLWQQTYAERPFLAKHAGRAAKSREAFYHLGMGKALALDRVDPRWKEQYFAPGVWLDDLLAASLTQ